MIATGSNGEPQRKKALTLVAQGLDFIVFFWLLDLGSNQGPTD